MNKVFQLIMLSSFASILSACSMMTGEKANYDANTAYKTADASIQQVAIPNSLSGEKMQNDYAVPPVASNDNASNVSILPPGSNIPAEGQKTATQQQAVSSQQAATAVANNTPRAQVRGNELTINKSMQQIWPQTGQALKSSGYSIVEQDSSMSTYYIADKVGSGGSLKRDTPIYQVHLQPDGSNTNILLLNSQNQPASGDVANRVLGAIRDKLS